jgi:hypothetical protein
MIIRLLSTQIPKFWELIKFSIIKVFAIPTEDIPAVCNKALAELLADNYQCFFKLSDDGEKVEAIVITTILLDKFTGQRSLSLECLYSFKLQAEWRTFFNFVKDFGRSQGCLDKDNNVIVYGYSHNPRAQNMMLELGFKEVLVTYKYIGG